MNAHMHLYKTEDDEAQDLDSWDDQYVDGPAHSRYVCMYVCMYVGR